MEHKLAKLDDVVNKTFDFVVVGGGLSGCVLAARLSENPNISVLLLEAGKAHFDDPHIPEVDGWTKLLFNPEHDWIFRTTEQQKATNSVTTADGKPTSSFYWSRGKGLGGSSLINFLYWTRPHREEADAIERLGNKGWNWDSIFEASKRAETFSPPVDHATEEYNSSYRPESVAYEGPIQVSFSRINSGLELVFLKTMEAHGIPIAVDTAGGQITGAWRNMSTIDPKTQSRSHAAKGYIWPELDRPNLKVLTEAYVHRILTKTDDGQLVATGAEFEYGDNTYNVNASKEVILSAGTVKSPHVLELSGIGDRAILEPLGIPVRLDLPSVGTNVQDHLIMGAYVFEMQVGHDFLTSDTIKLPEFQRKLRDIRGTDIESPALALSGTSFLPIQTFSDRAEQLIQALERKIALKVDMLPTGLKEQYVVQLDMLKDKSVPDIELIVFPFSIPPNDSGKPIVGLLPSIGHPFSRGTIHAASADPSIQPTIEPNYFSEDIDFEILVESVKFLRKFTNTSPWKDAAVQEAVPGTSTVSDEQLREHVRSNLSTTWHSCGSCSMLPRDKGGVVDTKLKVYGAKNLRVTDLSILPLIPSVHTQATTYGIAERAADIIKTDYQF